MHFCKRRLTIPGLSAVAEPLAIVKSVANVSLRLQNDDEQICAMQLEGDKAAGECHSSGSSGCAQPQICAKCRYTGQMRR